MHITLRCEIVKAKLCRSWFPRHCVSSGKYLLGGYAYKIKTQHPAANGVVIKKTYWLSSTAYMMLQLQAE